MELMTSVVGRLQIDNEDEHTVFLQDLLHNELIFRQLSPYLGVAALLALAATSKLLRSLVFETPQVFQYVDLSSDIEAYDMAFSEGACYSKPLDGALSIMKTHSVLSSVRILVLDGLNVPSDILMDLLLGQAYQIRIMSLRDVGMLSDDKLQRILRYLIRPSRPRPRDLPKLKGLYYFQGTTRTDPLSEYSSALARQPESEGITMRLGARLGAGSYVSSGGSAGNDPYDHSVYASPGIYTTPMNTEPTDEWASVLSACRGIISFDMVLCPHDPAQLSVLDPTPKIATIRLSGCEGCGTCPEGAAYPGKCVCFPPLVCRLSNTRCIKEISSEQGCKSLYV